VVCIFLFSIILSLYARISVREERNVNELQNATLRSPWSDGPLHTLSGMDI
jgi:hypothetical protein